MRAMIATLLGCALLLTACGSDSTGALPAEPTQPSNSAPSQPTQPPLPTGVPGQPLIADTPVRQPTATAASVAPSSTNGDPRIPTATSMFTPVPVAEQGKETPMPTPDQANEPMRPAPPYNVQPLTPPFGAAMDAQIDAAKQDLAQLLGIDASAIEVVEVDAVTWPDTSLGCPKPGMMYPQVLVDGVLVQLRANGQIYRYHGDGQRRLFLCDALAGPLGDQPGRPPRGDP
ncbi:hypothetical protein [Roseiflexus sp.]|uniref:hypothetical protein n=1 Tax=Roseiflexus sp. TaxID=2562120 RepID=UPI00258879E7|nr:hypothetical protein [Roseiflexus sp.]